MPEQIISSSVLIVSVVLLRFLLRGRRSARVRYALWLLVALRLLIPGSLFQVARTPAEPLTQAVEAVRYTTVKDHFYAKYDRESGETSGKQAEQYRNLPWVEEAVGGPYVIVGTADAEDPDEYRVDVAVRRDRFAVLRQVWYLGMAIMALWFLGSNLAFGLRLRKTAKPTAIPGVYTAAQPSPCLWGRRIYVTPCCLEDETQLRHVLAHEQAHLRHGDSLWSLARCLCLVIWWFHPLVWMAASLSRKDCELAADEGAVAALGEAERLAYGRTLLDIVANRSQPGSLLQTATTMHAGAKSLRTRIRRITDRKKVKWYILTLAVLLALLAAACSFVGTAEQEASVVEPEKPAEEPVKAAEDPPAAADPAPESRDDQPEGTSEVAAYTLLQDAWSLSLMLQQNGTGKFQSDGAYWLERLEEGHWNMVEPMVAPEAVPLELVSGAAVGWDIKLDKSYTWLPPGEYRLGVAVTDTQSGETGTHYAPFTLTPEQIEAFDADWQYEDFLRDLYRAGDGMELTLILPEESIEQTITISSEWYVDRFAAILSAETWTRPADVITDAGSELQMRLTALDGSRSLWFQSGNVVTCQEGDMLTQWLAAAFDGWDGMAQAIRREFDLLAASYENISFYHDGGPEAVAEYFAQVWGQHLVDQAPGSSCGAEEYRVLSWEVRQVSADGTAILGWFEAQLTPETGAYSGLWAGNSRPVEEGNYDGPMTLGREFVLQRDADGLWRCIQFGTGGCFLPGA